MDRYTVYKMYKNSLIYTAMFDYVAIKKIPEVSLDMELNNNVL